jgi:hypothetical protein
MGELLTSSQTGGTREQIFESWEELGFLDGLSGHTTENIAELYCCKASSLLSVTETRHIGGVDTADDESEVTVYEVVDDGILKTISKGGKDGTKESK